MGLAYIPKLNDIRISPNDYTPNRFSSLKEIPDSLQEVMGKREDSLGQLVFLKQVDFLNRKMKIFRMNFLTIGLHHLYFESPSPLIQGRTSDSFMYYIKIMKNNMNTNFNDSSLMWFNYLNNRFTPLSQKQLEQCTVIHSFLLLSLIHI